MKPAQRPKRAVKAEPQLKRVRWKTLLSAGSWDEALRSYANAIISIHIYKRWAMTRLNFCCLSAKSVHHHASKIVLNLSLIIHIIDAIQNGETSSASACSVRFPVAYRTLCFFPNGNDGAHPRTVSRWQIP